MMMRTSGSFQYSAFHEKYPESSWVNSMKMPKSCALLLSPLFHSQMPYAYNFKSTIAQSLALHTVFRAEYFIARVESLPITTTGKHVKNGEIPALKFPISKKLVWSDIYTCLKYEIIDLFKVKVF